MSSSAHPVTATEPASPALPLAGVSNAPNGAAAAEGAIEFSVTVIGPTAPPAPVRLIDTAVACAGASPGANSTENVSVAEPLPDVGVTCSHDGSAPIDQAIAGLPVCVMRTVWLPVADANDEPLLTAVKTSEVRSTAIVGGGTDNLKSTPVRVALA